MRKWLALVIRKQFWSLVFLAVTVLICASVFKMLIWPAYQNQSARIYTSKLGYATVLRKTGKPFPVTTAFASEKNITGSFLGEGLVQSEPIQVSMIAMSRITRILVQEGDRVKKGQRLVELDPRRIKLQIEAAAAALETARAEQERVRVGSVNILLDERPEFDNIQLEAALNSSSSQTKLLKEYKRLWNEGALSEEELILQNIRTKDAEVLLRKLKLRADLAAQGKKNSLRIAASTIREAEMAWKHRVSQLTDYVSYAPADGIVERVLVHEGEYNQDPGRPAMILASGIWFEANLDQTALGEIKKGNQVEIRLSAFQDRVLAGTVERIKPLVNFSLGGPETNRPIRPLGTGAPEWPATFSVRVKIEPTETPIVPGLTGFARITNSRTNVCVPRGSVSATSGNRGIVFVVSKHKFEPRDVAIGWTENGFTEILDGLKVGEEVIVDGYQVLQPGDQIECTQWQTSKATSSTEKDPVENEQVAITNSIATGL